MTASAATRRHLLAAAGALATAPAWAQTARPRVMLQTDKGMILAELYDDKAPLTAANFLHYVDSGRLNGGLFYRASRTPGAPSLGFIEGGLADRVPHFPPIAHESTLTTGLKHVDGTLSLARGDIGTGDSDFFICSGEAPYLDAHPEAPGDNQGYAAFGQVIDGMDVVRAILTSPTTGTAANPAMQGEIIDPPVKILSAKRA